MSEDKRKRSPNWMPSEKYLLVDLVEQQFHIIENKKTNGHSMKQKSAQWHVLTDQFNCQTMFSVRQPENLKAQWENLKKLAKKEESFIRMHRIQTGGGPADLKKTDILLARVSSLIKTSAVGLCNPFDNDSEVPVLGDVVVEDLTQATCSVDIKEILSSQIEERTLSLPVQAVTLNTNNVEETSTANVQDWGDYTPQLLQTPVSEKLRCDGKKYDTGKFGFSRRRPAHPASSSLQQLHQKKIEGINFRKDLADEEMKLTFAIKEEILKQEKINKRLLLLDLKIKKKKQLNK